jgi:hypothetical protein
MVGISIKIAGRLSKERIKPKQTVTSLKIGNLKTNNNQVSDSYKFTNKNKRGAFTISIKMCHTRNYSTNTR